jgi:hypothetical protein
VNAGQPLACLELTPLCLKRQLRYSLCSQSDISISVSDTSSWNEKGAQGPWVKL